MRGKSKGFTLIELMIVVAAIAILAMVALPSYREQIQKSRRSDAVSAMGRLQLAMERWRADNPSYANSAVPAASYPGAALPTSSYYTFSLSNQSATGYTVTATRAGAQSQDRCGTLTYTFTGDLSVKPQWATANCNN